MFESVFHSPLALFIAQAVLIIAVARGLGLVVRFIGLPMVISEILTGIVLGPSLLGWLWPGVSAALFPKNSLGLLQIFAQVGLVLFMFLVGLELDTKMVKKHGRASLLISIAGMAVPFSIGGGTATLLYDRLSSPDVRPLSFALFLGTALSITAVPVLARILSATQMLHSKVGTVALTCAAVNDVLAWCLLAFVVATARSAGMSSSLKPTLWTLVYVAVMWFVVRPLLRRLGQRGAGREGLSQNLVAAVFLLLFLSSFTTELIGIHALFGAFLFGILLPKEGGFAAKLADRLEDFAVVFLLPLFFAFSGLRTQVNLLSQAHLWVMFALFLSLAVVGKFGACTLAARVSGLSWRESAAVGVMMNTQGLMELVVLNIGLDLGVISPTMFTIMVLVALVSTVSTTPLLKLIYPQSLISAELAEPRAVDAFCLLLCVSYPATVPGMIKLSSALTLRSRERSRIYALKLQRVPERPSHYVADRQDPQAASQVLSPVLALAEEAQLKVRPIAFVSSHLARDIANVSEVKGANLVLLGWHRPLFNRAALSGTVGEVLEDARADVGVLVDRGLQTITRVLVPFHRTAQDRAALQLARRLLDQVGASITLLHVVDDDQTAPSQPDVDQLLREVFGTDAANVTVKRVLAAEPAEAALAEIRSETASPYDLVLVGVGRDWGLEARQFGIQQEFLIRQCPTSLLIVRGYDPSLHGDRAKTSAESSQSPDHVQPA
ncbi:MAG TPA: cation:proton antiporter [Pseudomonadota bacterium]|nr:cation:proton antiporter [Pseudomonadota bacterium]